MHLVRVLLGIHAAGTHHQVRGRVAQDILHMESAFREVAFEGAVRAIQVQVGPAAALAPPHEVTVRQEVRVPVLHIGVHALRHQGFGTVLA